MVEQMTQAWRFIFNHHPDGESIMHKIMDPDIQITQNQFRIWFHEARSN